MKRNAWLPITVPLALAITYGCNEKDGPAETGMPGGDEPVELYINEFLALNSTGYTDESGAFPDWVEIYNAGGKEVDLSGYWLTDDLGEKLKWQVPDGITVPGGGYLLILLDGDTAQGGVHASFSLDRLGGEDIGLYGPSSIDNPEIDAIEDFAPQAADQSYARVPDGSNTWALDPTPTPEAANDGAR